MNGVHDMGGMHGLGPLAIQRNDPVFHAPWEKRVFALTSAVGAWGRWSIDASRQTIEQMPAADYLAATYYEKWLFGLIENAVTHGLITRGEAESGQPDPRTSKVTPPLTAGTVAEIMDRGSPKTRVIERQPLFQPGDEIRTRNIHPVSHTRLPRYARDKRGVIIAVHGAHVFPRHKRPTAGGNPQPLYTLKFAATAFMGQCRQSARHGMPGPVGGIS